MERYISIKEKREYSKEFQNALNDVKNTQAGTAETLGRNTAINPEVIYNWANKYNINLTLNAYKYMKDLINFSKAVLNDKKI